MRGDPVDVGARSSDVGARALPDGYMVRPASVSDLGALAGIERRAGELFRSIGMDDVADDDGPAMADLESARADGRLWVATFDGRPVGYVLALVLGDATPHLEQISVEPGHGRKGLGAALVDQVAHWAVEFGAVRLTLSTFDEVPWNRPYYDSLGFTVLPEASWNPALRAVRDHEEHLGLALDQRVIMATDVTPAGATSTS